MYSKVVKGAILLQCAPYATETNNMPLLTPDELKKASAERMEYYANSGEIDSLEDF